MKFIIIMLALLPSALLAQSVVFTSLGGNSDHIFAGVKSQVKGHEAESHVLHITKDFEVKKVKLPPELLHREVISLVPASDGKLLVITQRTIEQGDQPLFHSYDLKSGEWRKEGEGHCVSFSVLTVKGKTISLNCVEIGENGKEILSDKKFTLKNINMGPEQKIPLPQTKLDAKELKAGLQGAPFAWKELKVEQGKKQKIIKP